MQSERIIPGWHVPAESEIDPQEYLAMLIAIANVRQVPSAAVAEQLGQDYGSAEVMGN